MVVGMKGGGGGFDEVSKNCHRMQVILIKDFEGCLVITEYWQRFHNTILHTRFPRELFTYKRPSVSFFKILSLSACYKGCLVVDISKTSITGKCKTFIIPPPKELFHCLLVVDFHH